MDYDFSVSNTTYTVYLFALQWHTATKQASCQPPESFTQIKQQMLPEAHEAKSK
jgi:hypothetical protein